jgi:hypothetical protein
MTKRNAPSMSVEELERPNVILGSGFSRSISEYMPTMAELGRQVIDWLALSETTLMTFNNNLEQWMSFLSHLSVGEHPACYGETRFLQ